MAFLLVAGRLMGFDMVTGAGEASAAFSPGVVGVMGSFGTGGKPPDALRKDEVEVATGPFRREDAG